ncbi:MAG: thiamine pyrophosphate-dependent enzyme [Candidatus Beckwithbacteria bacterium]|nr:thiamine pyrophosphate-dependent enzyme [Candidatus Beckwithbacteria bacterium]
MSQRVTNISPTWCPGCGNFAILGAIKAALDQLQIKTHQAVFVYDVGCSGNMADFVFAYGFHALHGRGLPPAAGIKLANHNLKVFVIIGDGGCYGEGVGHLLSLARGNHDVTVLTHDNFLYSLTTGQKSPTTPKGQVTPSTPLGTTDEPFNPLATALTNSASFVARGFAGDIPHLTKLLVEATKHQGFSLIDVLQPCPTYNKSRPYSWYREHVEYLDKLGHDPANLEAAWKASYKTDKLPIGVFYQVPRTPWHENFALLKDKPLVEADIRQIDLTQVLDEFK